MKSKVDETYHISYSDIQREKFDALVKLDPTTVCYDNTVIKLGKYSHWILNRYSKADSYVGERMLRKDYKILEYLTTHKEWFVKNHMKRDAKYVNIFKFKTITDMVQTMGNYYDEYECHKLYKDFPENVFTIFENDEIRVIEPLDFATCFKYSKTTEWCTKSENCFKSWGSTNLLLRFIDKKEKRMCRLTWSFNDNTEWSWATPIYPEFRDYAFGEKRDLDPFQFESFNYDMKTSNKDKLMELKKMHDKIDENCANLIRQHRLYRTHCNEIDRKKRLKDLEQPKIEIGATGDRYFLSGKWHEITTTVKGYFN